MNRLLIALGVILSAIWASVMAITRGVPVFVCGFLKSITFGVLDGALDNIQNGFYYELPNRDMPTVVFLILFVLAFILYFAISIKITKGESNKRTFFIVIFFSLLFRLILLPSISIHENDIYRYLWDGKVSNAGINPYKYAPDDLDSLTRNLEEHELKRLDGLREKNLLYFSRIGHSGVPTIYPPFAQFIFMLSTRIQEDSIIVMKGIFVVFDLLVILVIARILLHLKKNPALSIIYGWSPLVLKEIANSGHYDSIPIFFMMLSIFLVCKRKALLGAVGLIVAGLSKFFPIVLTPIYLKVVKLRNIIIAFLLFIGTYIPFFIWGNTGFSRVFKGLNIYSQGWAYNGSIYVLSRSILEAADLNIRIFGGFFLPKMISALIFIIVLIYISRRKIQPETGFIHHSFIILAVLFLLSPVGDPWYFCWIIPFLCFFPYRSFISLSWLLILSYISFSRELGWVMIGPLEVPVLNAIQYIPFYAILAIELIMKKRNRLRYV